MLTKNAKQHHFIPFLVVVAIYYNTNLKPKLLTDKMSNSPITSLCTQDSKNCLYTANVYTQWYMWVQKVKLKVFKKLLFNAFSTSFGSF